jgi:hypothetical protein
VQLIDILDCIMPHVSLSDQQLLAQANLMMAVPLIRYTDRSAASFVVPIELCKPMFSLLERLKSRKVHSYAVLGDKGCN